jgi:hypothetical protein
LTLGDEGSSRNQGFMGSREGSFEEDDDSMETLCEHQGITLLTNLSGVAKRIYPLDISRMSCLKEGSYSNARIITMVCLQ